MDKKLLRNILIAVAAIAILGGGYYMAVKWEPDKETPSETQSAEMITAFEMSEDDFKSLKTDNKNGGFSIEKTSDGYVLCGIDGASVKSGTVSSAVTTLKKLTAKKKLDFNESKLP